jgi:hypothetical protein
VLPRRETHAPAIASSREHSYSWVEYSAELQKGFLEMSPARVNK